MLAKASPGSPLAGRSEELRAWSKKYHHTELAVCAPISERYPLVIFAGDVGTGKTATAEGACDRLAREARKEAMLFKLSTAFTDRGKSAK